jgi:hypothetical protein
MNTIETLEQMAITHFVSNTYCDFCKKRIFENAPDHSYAGASFEVQFGYGSKYDGEKWKLDICDECAEQKLKEFKNDNIGVER